MAMEVSVNYWAVLVAAIANMVLGFVWYGPVFGKIWMQTCGFDKLSKKELSAMKEKGKKSMWIAAAGALVIGYVMSHFVDYVGATTVVAGMQLGFWLWLGFIAPITIGMVLWEGKPWKLYFIIAGYWLVSMLVMGSILALWQ